MRPKDTAYIIERLAVRFMAMVADHERQLAEHRAAFGARTEADAKLIAGLRAERDGLLTQVQDMRAEMERLREDERKAYQAGDALRAEVAALQERLRASIALRAEVAALQERLRASIALRAEVAALQERLRASIARGDLAQIEVAALKSQTPKHPVKVGEWVRRITAGSVGPIGTAGSVMVVWSDAYQVQLRKGFSTFWSFKDCEPCDPPEATHAEPDLTQLHAKGKEAWSDVPNATQWVEEMRGNTEATHDTEAGKAAAESAAKTEPVADEIKVGDLVEVYQATAVCTRQDDIGSRGIVEFADECVSLTPVDGFKAAQENHVGLCDVRKVTT